MPLDYSSLRSELEEHLPVGSDIESVFAYVRDAVDAHVWRHRLRPPGCFFIHPPLMDQQGASILIRFDADRLSPDMGAFLAHPDRRICIIDLRCTPIL